MKPSSSAAIIATAFCLIFTGCEGDAEPGAKDAHSAAEAKAVDLDAIVTSGMAAEVSGFPVSGVTKDYKPSEKYPQTDVLAYSWDNGRKRMAGAIEVPERDTVKFGWLRKSTKESIQAKTFDPNFKDFMEKVDDLGEYSLWNSRDQQLIVFQKGMEFSVWVNVSPDAEVNKTKSIQLAEKILSGQLK